MEHLIETYGYWAVLLGTFLEGETILVIAGFAAHRGYLALMPVILAAFAGSLCGDQLFFFLGRRHSEKLLKWRPSWQRKLEKANGLIERFHIPLILGFRFLYGLRTVMPFALGISRVKVAQFVALNAVGALVWAAAIGGCGYLFGDALEFLIGDIKHIELAMFATIGAVGAGVWGVYFYRRHKLANSQKIKSPPASGTGPSRMG